MENEFLISTEESYQEAMITIFEMMERGEDDLTPAEVEKLKHLTTAAEKYEAEYL
jgi:HTH-type transcriptional regulator / antitoxin HigA